MAGAGGGDAGVEMRSMHRRTPSVDSSTSGSPPAKRAKAAAPGATATRPSPAAELMGGWSQEDLLGASQG